jgi:hypothetical protein
MLSSLSGGDEHQTAPTAHQVGSFSVRNSFLIVLVVRRSLRLCTISPQFGVAAYLRGLKDRTRLQMVAQVGVA